MRRTRLWVREPRNRNERWSVGYWEQRKKKSPNDFRSLATCPTQGEAIEVARKIAKGRKEFFYE